MTDLPAGGPKSEPRHVKSPVPVDREAVTTRLRAPSRPSSSQSAVRASFIQAAGPHLQVLSDADRLADEIRDIVIETIPPPSGVPQVVDDDELPHTPREGATKPEGKR